ncbi:hypothetical protein AB833_10825 [Chromatiales bacterium (ex Bugula neritina AB1)]|nr:hypothetical protein AB833_10825 [Chromatiales bacterium (ex Bugula neritina AB1)]
MIQLCPLKFTASCWLVAFAISAKASEPDLATLARSEFERALSYIENTQLTLFATTKPVSTTAILGKLQERIEAEADTAPDRQSIDWQLPVMRGLLSETLETFNDQYANYISPQQLARYNERRNGNFVGVGLKFRVVANNYPIVIGTLLGGPLSKSNVLPGDRLISADGQDLRNLSSKEISKLLKGPAGSQVTITLSRQSNSTHSVLASRRSVDLHYARSETLQNDIGYIKISRFGSRTHSRVEGLLKNLLHRKVQGIILDLRDNPGGSTRAARAITSLFSHADTIYCERYKNGSIRNIPRYGNHQTDKPLIVLVNGNSMSSAEIVAGALQAHKRATIIGSPTFGKGLVQKVAHLKDPLGGAVRTTIAMFGTPDHQPIHGAGIVPDIYIESAADFMFRETGSLNISDQARLLQRQLREQSVRQTHPVSAAELITATDIQLARALVEIRKLASETNG